MCTSKFHRDKSWHLGQFFFSNISKFSSRHDTHYFTWPASPSIPTLVVTSYSVSHWCYGYKFRGDLSVCKRNKAFVCRLILYFYVFFSFFTFFLCTACTISIIIIIIIIIIASHDGIVRWEMGGSIWLTGPVEGAAPTYKAGQGAPTGGTYSCARGS